MRYTLPALILALLLTACGNARDATVKCPDNKDQQLTRDQWEACFGRQDKDGKGAK